MKKFLQRLLNNLLGWDSIVSHKFLKQAKVHAGTPPQLGIEAFLMGPGASRPAQSIALNRVTAQLQTCRGVCFSGAHHQGRNP